MPDGAGQRLSEGSCLKGAGFRSLQTELKTRENLGLAPPEDRWDLPWGAKLWSKSEKINFSHVPPKHQSGPSKNEIRPQDDFFCAPNGHLEVPDDAGQRLAQGKCLKGRDLGRSQWISKRVQISMRRLQGTPGAALGHQQIMQQLQLHSRGCAQIAVSRKGGG